jgi:hypothetical protein
LVWSLGWTVTGVHQVARSFGLKGQESSQNPVAREPDRLCSKLTGRKDSILGRVWAERQRGQPEIWELASDKGMYFSDYVVLCDGYVIYFHDVNKFNFF